GQGIDDGDEGSAGSGEVGRGNNGVKMRAVHKSRRERRTVKADRGTGYKAGAVHIERKRRAAGRNRGRSERQVQEGDRVSRCGIRIDSDAEKAVDYRDAGGVGDGSFERPGSPGGRCSANVARRGV